VRVLHVISSVDPADGGTIEAAKQSGLALQQLGHVVEIACVDAPDAPWVKGYPLTVRPLGPAMSRYAFAPKFKDWLMANADKFDVIIVHGIWEYTALATWQVSRKLNRPYVIYTHGMLDPWFKRRYPLKHLKKWLYWPWGTYRVLRDASRVLFTCEEERLSARESFWLYRASESVVPYCVPKPEGDPELQKEAFLSTFPILRDQPFLLYLSRIHPKKGVDILIRAFASVYGKNSTHRLVIAGPDTVGWVSDLQKLAAKSGVADSILWTGMLSGDQKWGAYYASEAFILPSHQENFGIVVPEALSCAKPALISDKVNIWREVADGDAGLVASDTLDGAIELMSNWNQMSSGSRTAMSKSAQRCFEEHFEVSKAVGGLVQVLREVTTN